MDSDKIYFDKLTLGDTFFFGKNQVVSEDPWNLEWEIIHQESDYQIAITRQLVNCMTFDAKESKNTVTYRTQAGNNNWAVSNIRQWLNSDAAAGQWYSAQHTYDAPPTISNLYTGISGTTDYTAKSGFLHYFTEEQKSFLQDFTLTLAKCSVDGGGSQIVTQKVFLPTLTQMGFGNNNGVSEGFIFDKFVDNNNSSRIMTTHPKLAENVPFINASEVGSINIANAPWTYILSSMSETDTKYRGGITYRITETGLSYNSSNCYNFTYGIAPCICLPRTGVCNG